ncbi:hypothetical protein BC941DRAFT_447928 [Chlamydoabsidia padenii]|nr:hypothetical protein BC941DRAFT_447928 [Chlamydoabsidia padenii]
MDPKDILGRIHELGLVDLSKAFDGPSSANKMLGGLIDSFKPTKKTAKGTDFMTALTLREPSSNYTTLNLNLFHTKSKELEKGKPNDIFLCLGGVASPKFKNYHAMKTAQWALFDGNSLEKLCQGDTAFTTINNLAEILTLYQTWNKRLPEPSTKMEIKWGTSGRKIMSTDKMVTNTFIDYIGMVVHCETNERNGVDITSLTLTDYSMNPKPIKTINKQQRRSLDKDLLIQCALFDENSRNCPEVSFGDYVYIKNAHCKVNNLDILELVVHHDKNPFQEKVWLLKENDTRLSDLKLRKQEFENAGKSFHYHTPQKRVKKEKQILTVKDEDNKKHSYSFIKDLFNGNFEEHHWLRATVVDYKPRNIEDISVKLCQYCGVSCVLKLKDVKEDFIFGTIYGTEDEPIFEGVPVKNLKENKTTCDQVTTFMNALCPLDEGNRPWVDLCVKCYVYTDTLRFVIENTKFTMI